ncbi:vitelline membrane outer layer protein 1 homolog [Pelobates fuscus]|uniref:vitelline membrane outer layer protein 1 homolog n=1 Tax=Pelobates fuscus TaxID=191477 RepID=UPI002FE4B6DA
MQSSGRFPTGLAALRRLRISPIRYDSEDSPLSEGLLCSSYYDFIELRDLLEDIMLVVAFALLCLLQIQQSHGCEIGVWNGGPWGNWGTLQTCPPGLKASGFRLKVEESQGRGDDTALNGIELYCTSGPTTDRNHSITSTVGPWGKWTVPIWCRNGFLYRFQLRVEIPQGKDDDTAANNIKFWCTDGSALEGQGLDWGDYGTPSSTCTRGISGMVTKVEPSQGNDDDTALNDVQFECAEY